MKFRIIEQEGLIKNKYAKATLGVGGDIIDLAANIGSMFGINTAFIKDVRGKWAGIKNWILKMKDVLGQTTKNIQVAKALKSDPKTLQNILKKTIILNETFETKINPQAKPDNDGYTVAPKASRVPSLNMSTEYDSEKIILETFALYHDGKEKTQSDALQQIQNITIDPNLISQNYVKRLKMPQEEIAQTASHILINFLTDFSYDKLRKLYDGKIANASERFYKNLLTQFNSYLSKLIAQSHQKEQLLQTYNQIPSHQTALMKWKNKITQKQMSENDWIAFVMDSNDIEEYKKLNNKEKKEYHQAITTLAGMK